MIQTFIFKPGQLAADTISITGSEAHHIARVLRLKAGDMVRLIDGQGSAYICEIFSIGSKRVDCRLVKTVKNSGEPGLLVTLAIGLSAASRFDAVIEKGTEVGVSRFMPLITEKGKVKIDTKSTAARKMNRWRRVCEAAVKQSGRSIIPVIDEPMLFYDFVQGCDPAETVLFHPGEYMGGVVLTDILKEKQALSILVGPESGFSAGELEAASDRGICRCNLGPRVLRTETAGAVLPALVIYLAEMLNA